MIARKIFPLNLTTSTDELKELIAKHPDYPIVVMAGYDASCPDYTYTYCSSISFSVGMILDCETPYTNEEVMMDEDDFKENIAYCLGDEYEDLSDEEFDRLVEDTATKYQEYWKDVIIITVDN